MQAAGSVRRKEDGTNETLHGDPPDEPELVFHVFRLASFSRNQGDEVRVFLPAEAVEPDTIGDPSLDVRGQAGSFLPAGGEILACGTCPKLRNSAGSELCPLSTMKDLHTLIREAGRVVTF